MTLRILGLDDDNHVLMYRCEDGTMFNTVKELLEFLGQPHDCQVEVRAFSCVEEAKGDLASYSYEEIDDMFYALEGIAPIPEGMTFEKMFDLFWNSENGMIR